jgi:hypothetical protein
MHWETRYINWNMEELIPELIYRLRKYFHLAYRLTLSSWKLNPGVYIIFLKLNFELKLSCNKEIVHS